MADEKASKLNAARAKFWKMANARAISDYNAFIDKHGIPLSEHLKF